MNLYLIIRTDEVSWDEYDSAIVCAESLEQARHVQPSNGAILTDDEMKADRWRDWAASSKEVDVQYIGMLDENLDYKAGVVICASYNAG